MRRSMMMKSIKAHKTVANASLEADGWAMVAVLSATTAV